MGAPNRGSRGEWLVALPPLAYLVLLFALPSALMVLASFRVAGEFGGLAPLLGADGHPNLTFEGYARLFASPIYLELFLRSLLYAAATTALCLVAGYPLAMLIARSSARWRDLLLLLVILPFWTNFLIRVYAWMIILGPSGWMSRLVNFFAAPLGLGPVTLMFSPFAVILVLVYVHLPFMVLPLYANLEKHDPALIDAAQDLGAGAWARFRHVTWPLSLPGVFAGSALVFIPAFGIFAVPDLVGGTSGNMVGNLIRQQFLEARDWPFGSVLSIVLTVVALALTGLAAVAARPRRAGLDPAARAVAGQGA
ncbi:MAG TPA: ABC transporter permease [Burkholderiaceae bacterium]|nr:ABC transporter permease [Burkholderiaceae bacterium]